MTCRRLTAVRRAAALALILGVASCESATDACDPNDPSCGAVPATVTLNPSVVTLTTVGSTQQITATVLDEGGQVIDGAAVTWRSDNQAVATVSVSGVVRAEGLGWTLVHATAGAAAAEAHVAICVPRGTLGFDAIRFESLAATDCRLASGSYADFWTLELASANAGLVQIDLVGGAFDTYLELLGSAGAVLAAGDNHTNAVGVPFYDQGARIVVPNLAAGTYSIVARSVAPGTTGAYQLSVGSGLLCPEEATIAIGASTSGQGLAPDDCSYDQFYADVYVLRVPSTDTVTITLASAAFDTYLTLLDPSGNVVFNDDNGAGGTNARISRSLAPAWYVVEVSSASQGETGSYTLTIN